MDLSLIIIASGFLGMYSLRVISEIIERLYYICCDIEDRKKEEEDKNNIPESVKHLYS